MTMGTPLIHALLVEDNEDDILLTRTILEEERIFIYLDVVRDGEEALRFLRKKGEFGSAATPDLILLDINMPRMNGFEALTAFKQDEALKYIPTVMLTTSSSETDVYSSFYRGACSFITKPIDVATFRKVLRDFGLYWTVVSRVPRRAGVAR